MGLEVTTVVADGSFEPVSVPEPVEVEHQLRLRSPAIPTTTTIRRMSSASAFRRLRLESPENGSAGGLALLLEQLLERIRGGGGVGHRETQVQEEVHDLGT